MRGMIERIKEVTGIYRLGFDPDSIMGVTLPIGIVVIVGGALWAFNRLFL
ncbi:MAG: hypothetical protein H0U40_01525 [Chloroflexia bacterium]|nr:hypothetical protein [Chloroflexia bacterium]MDQ3513997.1 hypothetical protein [Chloroflexota bacterium]